MAPNPRFRIYTRPRDYARIASDVLGRRVERGGTLAELESRLQEMVGVRHAVSMPKARVGIFLTLQAILASDHRKEVVLSPYTISDVINMVLCAGGRPVFADLAPDTCNLSPRSVIELTSRESTAAILVTHLHGLVCDMDPILHVARDANALVVEDAAQAFGTRIGAAYAGTVADAGIYSFGMYKNVNSFFGGMVVTNDDALAEALRRSVRAFPPQEVGYYLQKVISGVAADIATYPLLFRNVTFPLFRYGFLHDIRLLNRQVAVDVEPEAKTELPESYLRRMTPMQARLVLGQLDAVDRHLDLRIDAAKRYANGLETVEGITLPPLRTDRSHGYSYYPIQVEDRRWLISEMMRQGRDVAQQHLKNCAGLACFSEFFRPCPVAAKTAESVVLLPTYPRYGLSEVDANVRAIRRAFGMR